MARSLTKHAVFVVVGLAVLAAGMLALILAGGLERGLEGLRLPIICVSVVLAGVLLTLAIGYGLFWVARRTNRHGPESTTP